MEQFTGIYWLCPLCWVLAADAEKHEAWHVSRGEVIPDANIE